MLYFINQLPDSRDIYAGAILKMGFFDKSHALGSLICKTRSKDTIHTSDPLYRKEYGFHFFFFNNVIKYKKSTQTSNKRIRKYASYILSS